MGLDGAQRPPRLGGDLVEAQLAEEAQGDDLAIRLIKPADGVPQALGPLCSEGRDGGIRATRPVDPRGRIGRVDPGDIATPLRPTERDPYRDPSEPRPEGTVATPAGEAPKGGHECLLGSVLGLVEVTEDTMAGADDRGRFALDEDLERVPISRQDGFDCGAFIDDLGAGG
jgi:hypothetical protein